MPRMGYLPFVVPLPVFTLDPGETIIDEYDLAELRRISRSNHLSAITAIEDASNSSWEAGFATAYQFAAEHAGNEITWEKALAIAHHVSGPRRAQVAELCQKMREEMD